MKLHVLLPIALVPAVLLGELTRRAGISVLVGEVAAGVLLGPALLGALPAREGFGPLHELAHIGLCALLFRLGMETRPEALVAAGRRGALVGSLGFFLSFSLGFGLTVAFGWDLSAALLVGAALSASSISVPATVLAETASERSPDGAVVLSAALLSDFAGLMALSLVAALSAEGPGGAYRAGSALLQSVAFLGGGFLLGPPLVRRGLRLARRLESPTVLLVLAFSYLLLVAYAARAAGLAMVIGAYAAGLAFARLPERERLEAEIRPVVDLLRPLFFVLAGASVSFSVLHPADPGGRKLLVLSGVLLVAAVLGKLAGPSALRVPRARKRVIGFGTVARGGMGFVFAEIGLTSGALAPGVYSALALILTATTIIGAVGLRRALSRDGTPLSTAGA